MKFLNDSCHTLIENKAIDNKLFVCGIFIDLQKAFHFVCHNMLFHKLSHRGMRDLPNCWFSSYLCNRQKLATIN